MDLKKRLEEEVAAWSKACNRGDAARCIAIYAEDAKMLPPNQPLVRGKQAIKEFNQRMLDQVGGTISNGFVEFGGEGDLAYQVGTYTIADAKTPDQGKFVNIFRRPKVKKTSRKRKLCMGKSKLYTALIWTALWSILLVGPALASTWTLHWHWRPSSSPWEGQAKITLPEGDGPVTGSGTWQNQTHFFPPQGTLFTRGRLVIRGRVQNDILTFTPQFIIQERWRSDGQSVSIPNPDPGLYGPNDTESIRVEDGAEARSMSHGVPWVWRLSGVKKERWRITVDGWDRLASGGKPQAIPRPKSLGQPSPWTVGTGKSVQEKYSDVFFGVLVHWRMVVDVEIEKGKYKRGTGNVFMVSDTPFCQPPGVYHCQSRRAQVRNSPFTVYRGVKSGQQLKLTLFHPKYVLQRVTLSVSYECRLDKLAAQMTIVKWKAEHLPNQRTNTEAVLLPDRISVLLVDNWSRPEGQKGQPHARIYKVKKLK